MPPRNARNNAAAAQSAEAARSAEETNLFAEPNPDSFKTVVTGKHLWAARRDTTSGPNPPPGPTAAPLVPFEDLPLPRSDRAKIAACTIRWRFTGSFAISREENSARGSLIHQVKRFLEYRGFLNPTFTVNFPTGFGRGRFVDVCVERAHMAALAEAPLIYRGARLERHLIGLALPRTAMVLEITNFSENGDIYKLARTVALFLRPFAQVHDIWAEMHSTPGDDTLRPVNKIVVLAETEPTSHGGRDPSKVQAIPGYINLVGSHCVVHYVGRLNWCTTCRSSTTIFHTFDNCPRRCGKTMVS